MNFVFGGYAMYDISPIRNYILHLKAKYGLLVSLHPMKYNSVIFSDELMAFNIHNNPYCIFIKSCKGVKNHCVLKQEDVYKKATQGSYIDTCYAGVREFIYPLYNGQKNIGFISVSGYKTDNYKDYLKSVSIKYDISYSKLKNVYVQLETHFPRKEDIDVLILPLCQMLELALIKTQNENPKNISFPEKVMRYIIQYHAQNITSDDICNYFSCSRSYMSTEFNKYYGKSIRQCLTELRIEDAKTLLENTKLSVTEISYSVGFADSNYFSNIFKKSVGLSPLAYRKKITEI
jgi:AraC-like DNA-binding protein